MVNELIRTGAMNREEAATSRYRNVITRAVGLYPTVRTDTLHVELCAGDRLLLCSDGLSDLVAPDKMLRMCIRDNLIDGVGALIDAALDQGGKDNITAILVEPEEVLKAEVVAARAKAMENLFLFEDLPFHARLRVGRIISEINVNKGERIVEQGSVGNTLFVVVQGSVSVQVNGAEVAVLREGEHFGELALVDSEPRSADIVANESSQLLAIDRDTLQDYCVMEPALGNLMLWKLVATLGHRLRATNRALSDR